MPTTTVSAEAGRLDIKLHPSNPLSLPLEFETALELVGRTFQFLAGSTTDPRSAAPSYPITVSAPVVDDVITLALSEVQTATLRSRTTWWALRETTGGASIELIVGKIIPNANGTAAATTSATVTIEETTVQVNILGGANTAEHLAFTPAGGIAATNVQDAVEELDAEKAPLASPALTGNPTAPTPSPGDNDTSIATTAFVNAAVAALAAVGATDAEVATALAGLAALYQGLDGDLTELGGLSPANDDLVQQKAGVWVNRTPAQVAVDLQAAALDTAYAPRVHARLERDLFRGHPIDRVVAGDPPTINTSNTTGGASTPSSVIAGAVSVLPTDDAIRVLDGGKLPSTPDLDGVFYRPRYVSSALGTKYDCTFETMFDGTAFEFYVEYHNTQWLLLVDGVIASGGVVEGGADNTRALIHVDFGSRGAPRHIRLEMVGCALARFHIGPTDTMWRPPGPEPLRVMWGGDSFSGVTLGEPSWYFDTTPLLIGRAMGWSVWNMQLSGTGYVDNGVYQNFNAQLDLDLVANDPELVIVAHGRNDQPHTATVAAAAITAWDKIRAIGAELVVIGPYPSRNPEVANVIAVRDALQAAAAAEGVKFIDPLPWITGTGDVGTPTGSGNNDYYRKAGNIHPTTPWHRYAASRIIGEMQSLIYEGA